jgi:sugar/nucleoside kinase (ribokinase family)
MPTSERHGIACAGNLIIDAVKRIDVWPAEETLANVLSVTRGTGGCAYNVLLDLRALDGDIPLTAIGVLGTDANGDAIARDLAARRIHAPCRRTSDKPTSFTDVMSVAGSGRRTFFHYRGTNALLGPEDFPWDDLSARVLHLGYLLLLDRLDGEDPDFGTVAARVLAEARKRGIVTTVDVVSEASDRFSRIVRPALPHTDCLVCNEIEAGGVTGLELRKNGALDVDAVREAARLLMEAGVNEAAVIHVPEGGYALTARGEEHWHPALKVPPEFIAGTVGAGDAFAAGFVYATHEGWPMPERLRLGICAATASLADPTCTGGVLMLAETLALGARYGADGLR